MPPFPTLPRRGAQPGCLYPYPGVVSPQAYIMGSQLPRQQYTTLKPTQSLLDGLHNSESGICSCLNSEILEAGEARPLAHQPMNKHSQKT